MSARIAEAAGFQVIGLSGYAYSATRLGLPDAGYLSLPDLVDGIKNMSRRCGLPLIADADTGFGNAIGAMRTAEEIIGAGAAAMFIEDQVSPKRCGHVAGKAVVAPEEFEGKIRAVDRVRRAIDRDFVLIARSDARGISGGSMTDVIERGQRYISAGADVYFPEGLTTVDEIYQVSEAVGGPLLYNMVGHSPRIALPELASAGVFLVVFPIVAFQAAARAMWDVLHDLAAEDVAALDRFESAIKDHPVANAHRLVGFDGLRDLEDDLLPTAEVLARYDGAIGYGTSTARSGAD